MTVLFINQFYHPDAAATAQMLTDLTAHLAATGHDVHVWCSKGEYDTASADEARNDPPPANVTVHRVRAPGLAKRSTLGRLIEYAWFHAVIALRTMLLAGRYDVIVTLTTPPLIGLHATFATALRRRTRHVCWVMDLHPDCEFELGVLSRRNPIGKILDYLNGLHFRRAAANIVLGPYMRDRLLAKRVKPERIHSIALWGHPEASTPEADDLAAMREVLAVEGRFVVMYAGNAGLIHTFDAICHAARTLQDDDRIAFVVTGGGKRMVEVEQFQQKHHLTNLHVGPYVPRNQLGVLLHVADLHLITLRSGMAGVAVPSKLYGILAAGKPTLFVGPAACETADAIRDAECGTVIPDGPDAGEQLAAAIRSLVDDAELRRQQGENARRKFEADHDPTVQCQLIADCLASVASRRNTD